VERILLTGATGFVGRNLLGDLVESGYDVYVIIRRSPGFNIKANVITLKDPENRDWRFFSKLVSDNNIKSIIHVGAITGEKRMSWKQYYRTNVMWTKNLALGLINGTKTHRFIFISTVGVYGTNPLKLPADEMTQLNPDGKYHQSKVLAEKELLRLKEFYDLNLVILRPTIMYGYWDYGFLYKISRLVKLRIFPLVGNPIVHLLDVKKASNIIKLLLKKRKISGIYNLCDDYPVHIKQILDYLSSISGGGYIRIPGDMCKYLNKLQLQLVSTRIKLLCNSWYYDNSKIKKILKIEFGETLNNLDKYRKWYGGAR